MNSSTPSSTRIVPRADTTIRRFSKAKVVADRLGVCPRTIFRWANDGKFARHKTNARIVLFDEAEVAAFVDAARIENIPCDATKHLVAVGVRA
ncbi:MAG TPA: helix-turn-helix domain-containing protein [Opitutaceae bacterium]|nr:helix-turn-helix domain-containing protein [Opitutaceae bacterium]